MYFKIHLSIMLVVVFFLLNDCTNVVCPMLFWVSHGVLHVDVTYAIILDATHTCDTRQVSIATPWETPGNELSGVPSYILYTPVYTKSWKVYPHRVYRPFLVISGR